MDGRSWVIPLKMPDSQPNGNRPNAVLRMNGLDDFRICREGENHDWNPMGEDHLEVGVETGVGSVSDKVDGVGNFAALQRALYSSDIGVQGFGRASIERRHRAYDSTPALRDHQS